MKNKIYILIAVISFLFVNDAVKASQTKTYYGYDISLDYVNIKDKNKALEVKDYVAQLFFDIGIKKYFDNNIFVGIESNLNLLPLIDNNINLYDKVNIELYFHQIINLKAILGYQATENISLFLSAGASLNYFDISNNDYYDISTISKKGFELGQIFSLGFNKKLSDKLELTISYDLNKFKAKDIDFNKNSLKINFNCLF